MRKNLYQAHFLSKNRQKKLFFGTFFDDFGSGFGNFSENFAQKRVSNTHF